MCAPPGQEPPRPRSPPAPRSRTLRRARGSQTARPRDLPASSWERILHASQGPGPITGSGPCEQLLRPMIAEWRSECGCSAAAFSSAAAVRRTSRRKKGRLIHPPVSAVPCCRREQRPLGTNADVSVYELGGPWRKRERLALPSPRAPPSAQTACSAFSSPPIRRTPSSPHRAGSCARGGWVGNAPAALARAPDTPETRRHPSGQPQVSDATAAHWKPKNDGPTTAEHRAPRQVGDLGFAGRRP